LGCVSRPVTQTLPPPALPGRRWGHSSRWCSWTCMRSRWSSRCCRCGPSGSPPVRMPSSPFLRCMPWRSSRSLRCGGACRTGWDAGGCWRSPSRGGCFVRRDGAGGRAGLALRGARGAGHLRRRDVRHPARAGGGCHRSGRALAGDGLHRGGPGAGLRAGPRDGRAACEGLHVASVLCGGCGLRGEPGRGAASAAGDAPARCACAALPEIGSPGRCGRSPGGGCRG